MENAEETQAETRKSRKISIVIENDDKPRKISDESRKSVRLSKNSRLSMTRKSITMRSRPSYGFGSIPGLRTMERGSKETEHKRPPMVYLNTWQLASSKPFHVDNVQGAINEVLDQMFEGHKYNEQASPALAMRIASEVVRKIRTFEFNRYRLIAVVALAQRRAQSYNNAVAFLWDHTHDKYANVTRNNHTAFIQITVFGVYLD